MRKSLVIVLSAVAVLAFLLAGCGSGGNAGVDSSQAKKAATEPAVYKASLKGYEVSLNLPVSSDTTTKAIDSFVSKMNKVSGKSTEPYTVASYTVTNNSSESTIMEFDFSLGYSDGKKVDGQGAMFYIGDEQNRLPQEKLAESARNGFYNEGVNLYGRLTRLEAAQIGPGGRGTAYYVFNTGNLAGVDKVYVTRYGASQEMIKQ